MLELFALEPDRTANSMELLAGSVRTRRTALPGRF